MIFSLFWLFMLTFNINNQAQKTHMRDEQEEQLEETNVEKTV